MIIPYFILLALYTPVDWLLKQTGNKREIGKIGLFALICIAIWLGNYKMTPDLAVAWILLHFSYHQIVWGLLAAHDPFYLGKGIFDRIILALAGFSKWFYGILLAACIFIGIDLIRKHHEKNS